VRSLPTAIALRADIDALAITENTGLDYASEHTGCMHACGHDFHLTALLGAALLLRDSRDSLKGTVKLLFQPAEEGGGGALQVLGTGVLDDVSEIYGFHVAPEHEPGLVAVRSGATHAAVGAFRIYIHGKGGHAAYPHLCHDPIVAVSHFVDAAQTIVSRETDPFDQAVVSVTHINAGTTWNVIPSDALLEGTIRAKNTEKLTAISKRLEAIATNIADAFGVQADYNWQRDTVAVNNDPALTEFVADTAKKLGRTVTACTPSLGGEDYALYQERIPGTFWQIGVGSPFALHHAGFVADMAPLSGASELLAEVAKAALKRLGEGGPL
jgi:amidohydrolase